MRTDKLYTIDLSRLKGTGEFTCPKCKTKISPDDRSDDAYSVLEPIMNEDHLEKIVLRCNTCGSKIQLTGFHALDN